MATTVINDFTVEPSTETPPPAQERESVRPAAEVERQIETTVLREWERALRLWAY